MNQKLTLRIVSPYRGAAHIWSLDTFFSGLVLSANSDFQTLVTSVWGCYGAFMCKEPSGVPSAQLYSAALYSGSGGSPVFFNQYTTTLIAEAGSPTGLLPSADALSDAPEYNGILSTAIILQANCGLGKSGKPVYLRKYVHGVSPASSNEGAAPVLAGAASYLLPLSNGSLPHSIVATGPTGRTPISPWAINPWMTNHKLTRRNTVKTKTSVKTSSLIELLEVAAAAAE